LKAAARDQNKVTLKLSALEPIPAEGLVKLALVRPLHTTSLAASYELVAESGLVLELADESGRFRRSSEPPPGSTRPIVQDALAGGAAGDESSRPLRVSSDGYAMELPIRINRHERTVASETEISAQVSRRSIDVVQQTKIAVHFGALRSILIGVPAALADRWELLDREFVERQEVGPDPDGSRRYRLILERPLVDRQTLRFQYRLPLYPALDSKKNREIVLPEISFPEASVSSTKVGLSVPPDIVLQSSDSAWVRISEEVIPAADEKEPVLTFIRQPGKEAPHPFSFKAVACESLPMPPVLIPRLMIKTDLTEDGSHNRVSCWVDLHGAHLTFSLPPGAQWLGARASGRILEQVEFDPAQGRYRLRFPSDARSRPALVEFEYRTSGQGNSRLLATPRLLDGVVVLQSVWQLRVPGNYTIIGEPPGWFDENPWYSDGYPSKPGPSRSAASLRGWLLGAALTPSLSATDDLSESRYDESHRSDFVFSRSGQPIDLPLWIVPRAWLVAVCSGATLFLGFVAIFSRAQFRTIWIGLAVLGLLAAVFIRTSVLLLILQSAAIGVALTVLGLAVRGLIERARGMRLPSRESSLLSVRPPGDSALDRASGVGSDDSTAVRVRVPSTLDFVPAPALESPASDPSDGQHARSEMGTANA
jgi:hypothetical protein